VANRTGQPGYDEVKAILAAALEGGVSAFDTAAAYGSSEEVLGRALHELGVAERVLVVTKVRPLTPAELVDRHAAARAIEQSVEESRRRLRLDCLPVVLFHREPEAEAHFEVLAGLKAKGWLRHAGVSCDNRPGPAARFAARDGVDALQVPANILDRRHVRGGSMAAAAGNGVAVFVRSVFLQGLLLMPEADIPAALHAVIPARRRLAQVAAQAGLSPAELAVRYMLGQEGVTSVLAGVETVAQMRENIALFSRGPLDREVCAAAEAAVPDLPEMVLTPSRWPKAESGPAGR
jgi:aryl-alcohol dehydrogenase-like predicted oxidoreductase